MGIKSREIINNKNPGKVPSQLYIPLVKNIPRPQFIVFTDDVLKKMGIEPPAN